MNSSIRKAVTIVILVIACGLVAYGAVGGMMLILMNAGIYDPVAADGLSPERLPALRTRLIIEIAVAIAVLLVAAGCAKKIASNLLH